MKKIVLLAAFCTVGVPALAAERWYVVDIDQPKECVPASSAFGGRDTPERIREAADRKNGSVEILYSQDRSIALISDDDADVMLIKGKARCQAVVKAGKADIN